MVCRCVYFNTCVLHTCIRRVLGAPLLHDEAIHTYVPQRWEECNVKCSAHLVVHYSCKSPPVDMVSTKQLIMTLIDSLS